MYKLKFTLKQHTPLIHFQQDQEGATLRASEVKPKLDKFLRETLKQIRPELFVKYENLIALLPDSQKQENVPSPYSVAIQPVEDEFVEEFVIASLIPKSMVFEYEKKYTVLDKTPYFADNKPIKEGNLNEAKLGLKLKEGHYLIVYFKFRDTKWHELLKDALPLFFVSTNFGSRQSKGFGCFLPINTTQKEFENLLMMCFPIVFRSSQVKELKNKFFEIDSIYKNLKSGDRNNDSELRKYFNEFRPIIEWEKPAIQEKVAEISGSNLSIKSKTQNRQFVRALLGLAELYEYPKQDGIKAQVKNDTIARYGSPILFKILGDHVYLVASEQDYAKEILNKPFNFEFTHRGRKYGEKLSLMTPKEFDLVDFLQNAMKTQKKWNKI